MKDNLKIVLIIVMILVILIMSYIMISEHYSENNNEISSETDILENENDENKEKRVTYEIIKKYGVTYKDIDSDIEKKVEIDSIVLDYDTNYVKVLNDYFDYFSEDALNKNILVDDETYELFDGYYTKENLRQIKTLEIEVEEYENLASITLSNYQTHIESGGKFDKYVFNLNLETGYSYSNIEIINLFNLEIDDITKAINNCLYEDGEPGYIDTENIESLNIYTKNNELYYIFDYLQILDCKIS